MLEIQSSVFYYFTMVLLIFGIGCEGSKAGNSKESEIKNIFLKTELLEITITDKKINLRISDSEINIIETYLENKSNLLVYLLGQENVNEMRPLKMVNI